MTGTSWWDLPTETWIPPTDPATGRTPAKGFAQRYQSDTAMVKRRFPRLELRVYAIQLGVKLEACLWVPNERPEYAPDRVIIREALWQPPDVTERLVVEWGARALESWLAERAEIAIQQEKQ